MCTSDSIYRLMANFMAFVFSMLQPLNFAKGVQIHQWYYIDACACISGAIDKHVHTAKL